MGATGESRRKVADAGHDPAWSPDGRSLAVASEPLINPLARRIQSVISVVDLASGASRRLLEQDAVQPAWSPDGRRIAFWGLRGGMGGSGARDIWTVAVAGGEAVEVTMTRTSTGIPPGRPTGGCSILRAAGAARSISGACQSTRRPARRRARRSPSRHPPAGAPRSACLARVDGSPSSPGRSAPRSTASPSTRREAGWPEHPSSSSVGRA